MLRDLTPISDPKGGSPKTPVPESVRKLLTEDETTKVFIQTPDKNGNGGFAKVAGAIITGLLGALIGMTVAWWTALGEKGVNAAKLDETKKELMQAIDQNRKDSMEYTKYYSPYVMDKAVIAEHQSQQDEKIGKLMSQDQSIIDRITKLELKK